MLYFVNLTIFAEENLSRSEAFEGDDDGEKSSGVEAFAQVIDAFMSRMRLVFKDTVIRLENSPEAAGIKQDLCTALEIRIDR